MTQLDLLSKPVGMGTRPQLAAAIRSESQSIDGALQHIFKSPQEESRTQKARQIMGTAIADLSDEELEVYLTEFQYLIDEWLDCFERRVFEGVTLKQLIGQG